MNISAKFVVTAVFKSTVVLRTVPRLQMGSIYLNIEDIWDQEASHFFTTGQEFCVSFEPTEQFEELRT